MSSILVFPESTKLFANGPDASRLQFHFFERLKVKPLFVARCVRLPAICRVAGPVFTAIFGPERISAPQIKCRGGLYVSTILAGDA